ncbi:MAG: HAMP domain-containing protein [Gammaproteobacteria bacterium]|nr:HAMP domain-containing protein [Gammaproteobacteria bacterium]
MTTRFRNWPWLTVQIIAANVFTIALLGLAWYLTFMRQSSVYSDRLMSTFNIEPGRLHAMYVDDVERQLWISVVAGLITAIVASIGLALWIARPMRSLAQVTERLRQGDYSARAKTEKGEVGRLADNFNALALALQQEEQRRARFMMDLGHELRTPIMSLQGYTEGLEDGIFEADSAYYKLISRELNHLTSLTHTIETMQLDNTGTDCEGRNDTITIADLLETATYGWTSRLNQRGLELNLLMPESLGGCRLAAAPNTQKLIIDNLLSNMFRYASADGPCAIEVLLDSDQDMIKLIFSNEAPDVTEQALPFLFDRFYRVSESRTRVLNEHPSGLGLSVVRQLCLSNQGKITAALDGSRLLISVMLPILK